MRFDPSKVRACPVVGAVESRVEVAPLERDEIETLGDKRESTVAEE
jgi:hypothetical protein